MALSKAFGAAFRNLGRAPAFSVLVVLTLALGIGATIAMFSVVDAVLINPLPFPHAERIVEVWTRFEEGAARAPGATAQVVTTLRQQDELFDTVAAYQFGAATLTGDGEPEMLSVPSLSPNIFAVFPASPVVGRLFDVADATSKAPVLLLSERLWTSRYGRDPGIVGKTVIIDDAPLRVIGVLPARFTFPESSADAWRAVDVDSPDVRARVQLVAMRKAGISTAQVDDRLQVLSASLLSSGVLPKGQSLMTETPIQVRLGRSSANALYLLLGAVAVLLIVACVNVCNLMLVRASSRHGELALKAAIGAGRGHLLRDAVVESALLAFCGGAIGLVIANALLDVILGLAPDQLRMLALTSGDLDLRAVSFAIAATVTTCLVFGILPAWRASSVDPIDALKQQSRSASGRDDWWQGALVSIQMALVLVLLAGAGLLLRSFIKLNQVDLGFNPDGLVLLELQMTSSRYSAPNAALGFMREVEARVEAQLGVEATVVTATPVRGGGFYVEPKAEAEGLTPPAGVTHLPTMRVSPDFFEVFQIPLLAGRTFEPADGDFSIIVNDVLARRYWGDASPLGRRFRADSNTPWLTVVGVARDVKTMGPADPMGDGMEIYQPFLAQGRSNFLTIAVAGSTDADATLAHMKRIVWDVDPQMPILGARSVNEQLGESVARPRFILSLAGAFTMCAVVIAAVGVYGVSSYWVARRRRELAIRLAMGAPPDRLVMTVIGRILRLAAVGAAIGLAISLAGARVMTALLFATDARDPLTFIGITALLAMLAIVACAVPAVRAARVDPMTTLRAE